MEHFRQSKEFIDMQDEFEKFAKGNLYRYRLDRTPKWKPGDPTREGFYECGHTNQLFTAFMGGYSFGKSIHS